MIEQVLSNVLEAFVDMLSEGLIIVIRTIILIIKITKLVMNTAHFWIEMIKLFIWCFWELSRMLNN